VTAGRADLGGAPGTRPAAHITQIRLASHAGGTRGRPGPVLAGYRHRQVAAVAAAQVREQAGEARYWQDAHPGNQRGFGGAGLRHGHGGEAAGGGSGHGGQDAGDRAQLAVEAEFTEQDQTGQGSRLELLDRSYGDSE